MNKIAVLLVMSFSAVVVCAQTSQPSAKGADKDVIAIVLGKKLTVKDKDNLNFLIFGSLLQQFAKDNKIEPTAEELDDYYDFIVKTQRRLQIKWEEDRKKLVAELKATTLSERERKNKESRLQTIESILKTTREMKEKTKGMEEQLRQVARQFVGRWKINKALYAKYGGRVIFQQLGVEPLDAYRDFLREQEKNGAFQILDNEVRGPFWRYFTNDSMHTFYSKDDGAKFINTPWWMMEQPPEE